MLKVACENLWKGTSDDPTCLFLVNTHTYSYEETQQI